MRRHLHSPWRQVKSHGARCVSRVHPHNTSTQQQLLREHLVSKDSFEYQQHSAAEQEICACDPSRGEKKAKTKLKPSGMDLENFRAVF